MSSNPVLSLSEIQILEKQISMLFDCKPLSEDEVRNLCEKVKIKRQKKCLKKKAMFNL